MKLRPVFLVLVIAAIFPSLTLCQNQQYMNCHTQESSGNFVASNETIVNGMVCQIAKPKSTVVASSTPGTTLNQVVRWELRYDKCPPQMQWSRSLF